MTDNIQSPVQPAHGHRVLVCLDRSPASELALRYVIDVAKTFESAVTLVYVMEQPRPERAGPQTSDVLSWEIARREASVYLDQLRAQTADALGRSIQARLEQGAPAERIADVAREIGADLIVLSSHGEGGATSSNLGSTAQRLLAISRTSIFIVHTANAISRMPPRRLLVPLDGSLRTESVLPTSARIARAYDAELLLVHVVQEPLPTLVLHAAEDLALANELASRLEQEGRRYLQRLGDRLTHEHTTVRTLVVRHANERQALLEVSRDEEVDLIVLSAHGSACDAGHSFGSVTTDLLAHSELPMLVLQDLREQGEDREAPHSSAPPLRSSFPPEVE